MYNLRLKKNNIEIVKFDHESYVQIYIKRNS